MYLNNIMNLIHLRLKALFCLYIRIRKKEYTIYVLIETAHTEKMQTFWDVQYGTKYHFRLYNTEANNV